MLGYAINFSLTDSEEANANWNGDRILFCAINNERDLNIQAGRVILTAKQADLIAKNNAFATVYTNLSNSRISRDSTLYRTNTKFFDIATEVKKYIKSVFRATSPQFAPVKGIEFTNRKK